MLAMRSPRDVADLVARLDWTSEHVVCGRAVCGARIAHVYRFPQAERDEVKSQAPYQDPSSYNTIDWDFTHLTVGIPLQGMFP